MVIEIAKSQNLLLGEALAQGGFVRQEDIDDVVRGQIEEEIYDLFLWDRADFEFVEGPPIEELRDPPAVEVVPLHAERQGLDPKQGLEGVHGGHGGAQVAQADRMGVGGEGEVPKGLPEPEPMISRLRLR